MDPEALSNVRLSCLFQGFHVDLHATQGFALGYRRLPFQGNGCHRYQLCRVCSECVDFLFRSFFGDSDQEAIASSSGYHCPAARRRGSRRRGRRSSSSSTRPSRSRMTNSLNVGASNASSKRSFLQSCSAA